MRSGHRFGSGTWAEKACIGAVVSACLFAPAVARAGDWVRPVGGMAVLEYGAKYDGPDGASRSHGGLDLAGAAGETVRACASGEVVFAGRVPAGEGAQSFAVTVLTAEGLRVTYLPLRSATVASGATVSAGDPIGALDSDGDASSTATHLHLGVRRGETRLDPASFLGRLGGAAPSTPAAAPVAPVAPSPSGATGLAQAGALGGSLSAQAMPAPAAAPRLEPSDLLMSAIGDAADALVRIPPLRRVSRFAETPHLNLTRAWSDVRHGRGRLAAALAGIGAVLVGGGCAFVVARSLRRAARAAADVLTTPALVAAEGETTAPRTRADERRFPF